VSTSTTSDSHHDESGGLNSARHQLGAPSQHLDLLALRVPELNSQLHNVFRFTIQR